MNNLLINTPQNVNFEYKLASVGSRILAFGIDYGIMLLYAFLVALFFQITDILTGLDSWATWGIYSLMYLPIFFYPLLCETFMNGQTFGKKILKLKVVKIDGTRATFYQYFIRWVSNAVDIFLSMGGIGLTSIILSQKGQRLGDIAADTTVISLKENLNLKETVFEDLAVEHAIVYPEVYKISDKDINEIKDIYNTGYRRKNYEIIKALASKVEVMIGKKASERPEDFVAQVIQDHYYSFKDN
ncbi:RDD family protein [Sphingobacterium bovistauri]|uniref:RDD family protein n=1 Tax=Sphingobacterium bovistauri TaxID=2781959 RepID=A0ABS7Z6U6_9SPHI|nr:RDD family protein [Sphingobacterium bovistauri]MCA5005870.1 RDD family protein [Sphingobacterium bovistauri]